MGYLRQRGLLLADADGQAGGRADCVRPPAMVFGRRRPKVGCYAASVVAFGLALLLVGCATRLQPVGIEQRSQWLPFLVEGVTRRPEVVERLGPPRFQAGQIDGYEVSRDTQDRVTPGCVDKTCHHLILEYDGRGVLRRHSLLRVR